VQWSPHDEVSESSVGQELLCLWDWDSSGTQEGERPPWESSIRGLEGQSAHGRMKERRKQTSQERRNGFIPDWVIKIVTNGRLGWLIETWVLGLTTMNGSWCPWSFPICEGLRNGPYCPRCFVSVLQCCFPPFKCLFFGSCV
jgi:hypothetical protein